jgi:pimeloyl-ACP methyl ester carboxylesterase
MPYVDLPGVRLWFSDSGGSGTPAVFLHPASGTSESWVYQLPAFTAGGYRCVTYDRRARGRSQPSDSGPQPGFAADDLHGLIEHLGLDRVHLVASAAGAGYALDYALERPERVRSVVVADGTGGVQDPEYLDMQRRIRPPEIEALPVELRELGPSYRATDPDGVRRWLEIAHSVHTQSGTPARQANRKHITFALLETIKAPVLVLAGDADLLTPPAQMRLLAAHIPNAEFATIPEAGHAAFWERPDEWNHTALDFIARH